MTFKNDMSRKIWLKVTPGPAILCNRAPRMFSCATIRYRNVYNQFVRTQMRAKTTRAGMKRREDQRQVCSAACLGSRSCATAIQSNYRVLIHFQIYGCWACTVSAKRLVLERKAT